MKPLRVCIDARLSGGHGGVEQLVIGVAGGLSELRGGDEEYLFLVNPGENEWLRSYLGPNCRMISMGDPIPLRSHIALLFDRVSRRRRWPPPLGGFAPTDLAQLGISNGTIEAAGVGVMHFLLTGGFLTRVPTIYNPHDLQHLHYPEFFPPGEVERRELTYRTFCERATLAVMMTSSGKADLVEQFGTPPDKVAVVPGASVLPNYTVPSQADLDAVAERLALPERFFLFPAQTWAHKNHLRLLEAMAILRDERDLEVTVVCPGKQNDHFNQIEARISELGLAQTARFPGFVTPLELRSLYQLATAMVFPSLFEGWGLPVSEALSIGLPVTCSTFPSLLDVAGDAALTFDPKDPNQIADAMMRAWKDPALRKSLAEKGKARSKEFTFERTVRLLRAHYRQVGGRPLSGEDQQLLAAPPLT